MFVCSGGVRVDLEDLGVLGKVYVIKLTLKEVERNNISNYPLHIYHCA